MAVQLEHVAMLHEVERHRLGRGQRAGAAAGPAAARAVRRHRRDREAEGGELAGGPPASQTGGEALGFGGGSASALLGGAPPSWCVRQSQGSGKCADKEKEEGEEEEIR